ncbi:MAG TPA: hypothetical protein DEP84_01545 [Chloroflexi bacterium]|nr:hypothetical protein [Chloroflexota bacterium]
MDDQNLTAAVLDALNAYHDLEALEAVQLASLQITRHLRRGLAVSSLMAAHATGLAVRRLVDQALAQLDRDQPAAADLLRLRFRQGRLVRELTDERRIGISTFYERQHKALAALATIVAEMEAQAGTASASRRRALMALLPPPTYRELVGCEEHLTFLAQTLTSSLSRPGYPLAITGLGGLGKTSLAREALVHWLAEHQPAIERILWATVAQGDGPAGLPEGRRERYALDQVLSQLGEQLDEPVNALPGNEQRLRLLAGRLAWEPSVVVIDNVETPDEVSLALTIANVLAPVAQLLITSRHRIDQTNVQPVELRELGVEDALRLMHLEAQRLRIEPLDDSTGREFYRHIGGNPLALKLVVAQTGYLPASPVLEGLHKREPSMHRLFAHVYDTSWQLLSERAQQILLGLVLLPPAGATWTGLRVAAESGGDRCDDTALAGAVDELAALSLLQVSPALDPVYSLHRLTYRFLERKLKLLEEENEE